MVYLTSFLKYSRNKTLKLINWANEKKITNPLLALTFFLLLTSRRWSQLVCPQVWNEDGTVIFGLATKGLTSIFEPINGYLIVISRIISAVSLSISFTQYHIISTIICWLFIIFVVMCVALCPTYLKRKTLCAFLIFFIPTNPEVFGIPLYSFWWSSILLFLLVLWDEKYSFPLLRILFLLIGGLSSPIIILISPLLIYRIVHFKNILIEKIIALISLSITTIQLYFVSQTLPGKIPEINSIVKNVTPVFLGNFVIGNFVIGNPYVLWFLGMIVLIMIILFFLKTKPNFLRLSIIYLLLGTIASSVIRIDPIRIHPQFAGPRYFFFTYIILYWLLIQLSTNTKTKLIKIFPNILILAAIINAFPVWNRKHSDLNWIYHAKKCANYENYVIPIQINGKSNPTWSLKLPKETCTKLLKKDLLLKNKKNE